MGELLIARPLFRADTDVAQLEAIFKVRQGLWVGGGYVCWWCIGIELLIESLRCVGVVACGWVGG